MTSKVFIFQDIFINQKLHCMILVIHQPHDTDCSRFDIEGGVRTSHAVDGQSRHGHERHHADKHFKKTRDSHILPIK